ncbi:MAG: aminodeoxychorismate synthase component I [Myxococcales bacterium]|nr:aminodeoxychorismate synthase component I [Myxococcales bacterium]
MRTLIIDNHDSFTFNLHHMLAALNGAPPRVIPNDHREPIDWRALPFDNIVISPGPGRPERPADLGVGARAILEARVPVLGVCLGHQAIAHLHGGAIEHAPAPMHGRVSAVVHDGDPLFAGVPPTLAVVRYHSLIVARPLPGELAAIAWTRDDGLVMALRHRARPLWGVQFHPESICSEHGRRLLENFCELTRARSRPQAIELDVARAPSSTRARASSSAGRGDYELHTRALARLPDVERAFTRLYARSPRAFWLDSSLAGGDARFSFIGDGAGPESLELQHRVDERTITVTGSGAAPTVHRGDLFEYLAAALERRAVSDPALPFDFQAGFVGYLGYELKGACGLSNRHRARWPDARLLLADRVIAFDHRERVTYLLCLGRGRDGARAATRWLDAVTRELAALPMTSAPDEAKPVSRQLAPPSDLRLRRPRAGYLDDIARCLEHLRDGESYELCLTNQLETAARPDPLAFYRALRRRSPAPYAALLRFGELAIASSSPERFLKIDPDGAVESRPIKGTAPRGRTPAEDDELRARLAASEKDRAENLMIVDLVRNDLSRVCEVGSVRVPQLMEVLRYATVHQLESRVRGQLRPDARPVDCVRAAFPGGSMTGAPKRRTVELLDALEPGARGVYSGALGYLSLSGAVDLSIVIRTAVIDAAGTSIGTGGAIVTQSDPAREFDEIMLKARALVDALAETAGDA